MTTRLRIVLARAFGLFRQRRADRELQDELGAHLAEAEEDYRQRGLSPEDAKFVVETLGTFEVPTSWDDFIARHQETVDLLVKEQGQEPLDVESLYDRRYEEAIADAVAESTGDGS